MLFYCSTLDCFLAGVLLRLRESRLITGAEVDNIGAQPEI